MGAFHRFTDAQYLSTCSWIALIASSRPDRLEDVAEAPLRLQILLDGDALRGNVRVRDIAVHGFLEARIPHSTASFATSGVFEGSYFHPVGQERMR